MSVIGNTALSFGEEPAMLMDVARDFCRDHGMEAARAQLETPLAHTAAQWDAVVAMGWTGIGIDEAGGGAGLSIAAAVPVVESMGRVLMGVPLIPTLLAAQLLRRAGDDAADAVLSAIAAGAPATVAELESEDWSAAPTTRLDSAGLLRGEKRMVPDAQSARYIVVTAVSDAGPTLAVVDAQSLNADALRPRLLIDHTRRAADVNLDAVKPVALLSGGRVRAALRDHRLLGALLVAAESAGAAASCLDTVVAYLKTRKQFGKLIGSYQALKHPSVEILNAIDAARSFVFHAATLVDNGPLSRDAEIACRMAKAQASEALSFAGDRAIQFHGGMGFTWDCDAQLFLRRAQWAQQQFGDATEHRASLAELLIDHRDTASTT
ncbi:MAG: acyl-CoA dehydrogenase family protein [Pseudomonadota bacterium]